MNHSRYAPASEAQHQAALCDWWAIACRKFGIREAALAHIPNEGRRSIGMGARLKREGMRKGFPDLVLCFPAHGKGALFIELKTWSGKVRAEQADYLEMLRDNGYAACVCFGWEAARKCIEDYLDGKDIPEQM